MRSQATSITPTGDTRTVIGSGAEITQPDDYGNVSVTSSGINYRINDIIKFPYVGTASSVITLDSDIGLTLSNKRIGVVIHKNSTKIVNNIISGIADISSSQNSTIINFKKVFGGYVTQGNHYGILLYDFENLCHHLQYKLYLENLDHSLREVAINIHFLGNPKISFPWSLLYLDSTL